MSASANQASDLVKLSPLSLTVNQFCRLHSIGRTSYYKLKKLGKLPPTFMIGRTRRIAYADAVAWRGE